MLSESAHVRGRKRRASMLDQTDFEAAFDDIVSPRQRPLWFSLMADLGVLLAGILIAYAINVLTGTPAATAAWLIPLIAGIFVTAFCLAIKYLIKF